VTRYSAYELAKLPKEQRAAVLAELTPERLLALRHDWGFWARPEQLAPPGDWSVWLMLAGRGWGKTRSLVEWARTRALAEPCRGAVVAATAADARDVLVEGESGFLHVGHPATRPEYEPSKRRLTFSNGSTITLHSADVPGRLRGPQYHYALADELAIWRRDDAWSTLELTVRLGTDPRIVVATTPRPIPLIRDLLADPDVVVTSGNTYENQANLAPRFLERIRARYEGTTLGRQELYAELLDDVEGALWTLSQLDELRVKSHPELERVVVAIDPAATSGPNADDTGIVVAGIGVDGDGYVLDDVSLHGSPHAWATAVVKAYRDWEADRVIGETNNGGEMVEHTLRTVDPALPYRAIHASRGKKTRAEPIAALYEQGRIHHVGRLAKLEDEMCQWLPSDPRQDSPDRVDALVWALTELMLNRRSRKKEARSYAY
jgi:phage terminase large subunit-like protein